MSQSDSNIANPAPDYPHRREAPARPRRHSFVAFSVTCETGDSRSCLGKTSKMSSNRFSFRPSKRL